MPAEDIRTLWCLVDGDPAPFQVSVDVRVNIDLLKKEIKRKKVLHDLDAPRITVWKVRISYMLA